MEALIMFLAFSAVVTTSSEVMKNLIKLYKPDWKVGLPLAIAFGLATSLTYGTGLLSGLFQIGYDEAWCTLGFKIVDLIMSGLIYSLSSKAIVDLYDTVKGKKV